MTVGTFISNRASTVDYDRGSNGRVFEERAPHPPGTISRARKKTSRTYEQVRFDTAPSARACYIVSAHISQSDGKYDSRKKKEGKREGAV